MSKVVFKHPDQACVYPKLLAAVNQVCNDFGKDALCVAGYRSLECQKATNAGVLAIRKGSYQLTNGAVYTGNGVNRKCWASAYGKSNHCFCIAMDMNGWFESLTNAQLKKYGLVKPMDYEPWHVTLVELVGISQAKKEAIRDSTLNKIKEEESDMGKAFKDVEDSRWSAKHIEAAKKLGIISGNKDGTFNPTGTLTREQAAVLIVELYEKITGKKVL